MKSAFILFVFFFQAFVSAIRAQRTIRVPKDYTTIQAAINVAKDKDTVLVSPGTYKENIDFKGKAITVKSSGGPKVTTIDGSQKGSVVIFKSEEGSKSILEGFTITNGRAPEGGGIYCQDISSRPLTPKIYGNWVVGNVSTAGGGGGIWCHSGASPEIGNNRIEGNSCTPRGSGGGISVNTNCYPVIYNNFIYNNSALGVNDGGGGIFCGGSSSQWLQIITNNTVVHNSASKGGGIHNWGSRVIVTNTIVWDNKAGTGPEFLAQAGGTFNVTYSDVRGGWSGTGNINADPRFVDSSKKDFHLLANSPCIDKGTNFAPSLPPTDIDNEPRIGNRIVDIGADEFYPGNILHVPSKSYPNIMSAMRAAKQGYSILVAPGRYKESVDFLGKAVTLRSTRGPWFTTIDGSSANKSVVTFKNGEDLKSVLNGFTIIGGLGTGALGKRYGGGVYCLGASPTLMNNIVLGNQADHGGGLYCSSASPRIRNTIIIRNKADKTGAGIHCAGGSNLDIANSFILGGSTGALGVGQGGGIYCSGSSPSITNCTIANNMAAGKGSGILCSQSSSPRIRNSIFWANGFFSTDEIVVLSGNPSVSYSCIRGGWNGKGSNNIKEDPVFVAPLSSDYHIHTRSPCRDKGDNSVLSALPRDFDGQPRRGAARVDIGADEFYHVTYYGIGTAGIQGVPIIRISGEPLLSNLNLEITLSGAPPNALVFLNAAPPIPLLQSPNHWGGGPTFTRLNRAFKTAGHTTPGLLPLAVTGWDFKYLDSLLKRLQRFDIPAVLEIFLGRFAFTDLNGNVKIRVSQLPNIHPGTVVHFQWLVQDQNAYGTLALGEILFVASTAVTVLTAGAGGGSFVTLVVSAVLGLFLDEVFPFSSTQGMTVVFKK